MYKRIGKEILPFVIIVFLFGCGGYSATPGISHKEASFPLKAPEVAPNLAITPNKGKANTNLEIFGSGFLSGEKIMILLTAEGLVKGKNIGTIVIGLAKEESGGIVVADDNGTFILIRKFPVNIKPGVYTIEAKGDKGSRASCLIEFLPEQ